MKKILIILAVIFVVLLIVAFSIFSWVKGTYNSIVTIDEEVNGAWAQLENVLQRRFDLIPNLVETVKGYASHESDVLTRVTEARAKVGGAGTPAARMQAEGELSSALSRLMVVVENYPDLKANQNFLSLQVQLEGHEDLSYSTHRHPRTGKRACVIVNFGDDSHGASVSFDGNEKGSAVIHEPFARRRRVKLPADVTVPPEWLVIVAEE